MAGFIKLVNFFVALPIDKVRISKYFEDDRYISALVLREKIEFCTKIENDSGFLKSSLLVYWKEKDP